MKQDLTFAVCGLCGEEQDSGYGFTKGKYDRPTWVCRECFPLAGHAIRINQMDRSVFDKEARDNAGAAGAEYLESIDKLDLTKLDETEWTKFLDIMFRKKASELRRLLSPICPPF